MFENTNDPPLAAVLADIRHSQWLPDPADRDA